MTQQSPDGCPVCTHGVRSTAAWLDGHCCRSGGILPDWRRLPFPAPDRGLRGWRFEIFIQLPIQPTDYFVFSAPRLSWDPNKSVSLAGSCAFWHLPQHAEGSRWHGVG